MLTPRCFTRFLLHSLLIASAALCRGVAADPASPPGADIFFAPPTFRLPSLSPDGSKLCALTRFDDRHYALTLISLTSKQVTTLIKADELTVVSYWWKSDDLLLAMIEGEGGRRLFQTVDLKSGKLRALDSLEVYWGIEFVSDLPDDPEQMLFRLATGSALEVKKINLRTGRETAVESAPANITEWCINRTGDALAGYGFDPDKERWFIIWRTSVGAKWQRRESPYRQPLMIVPIAVAPDQQRIIAIDYTHSPTGSVGYLDPATGGTQELFAPAEIEPSRHLTWGDHRQVVAVAYDGSKSTVRYFDPEVGRAHEWLEAALPGTRRTTVSVSRDQSKALIYAETDRTAGMYCLADFNTKKVAVLRSSMSGLNPASLAPSRFFRFSSSDDLPITGRITLPAGVAQPPLVLFIGPALQGPRSEAAFNPVAQFLASRGYATARIDHRGTQGFSRTFSAAGDLQSGTGTVRDYTAAKAWLAAQGWIDPDRVAVIGDHLGGFVAFQLATLPGFARALVNLETPTDAHEWSIGMFITSPRHPQEVLDEIGGTKAFYSYRELVSPFKVAGKLTTPSFHYYSKFENGTDRSSRALESRGLEASLKKLGKPFEFISAEPVSRKTSVQTTDWRQTVQCYEAIAAFLGKELP